MSGIRMWDEAEPAARPLSSDVVRRRFRSLFLSDIHLGARGCKAGMLLEFLAHHDADTIYLVGDVVDGWLVRWSWRWLPSHRAVVRAFLEKHRSGSRIVYVVGNHDEFLRDYLDVMSEDFEILDSIVHQTADGTRYLVIHGDQFDFIMKHAKWLGVIGARFLATALDVNAVINFVLRRLGRREWSLPLWVKTVVSPFHNFEHAAVRRARSQGLDGVICGHVHKPQMRRTEGIFYVNTGDWVEHCTAVVERADGSLAQIVWRGARSGTMDGDGPEWRAGSGAHARP